MIFLPNRLLGRLPSKQDPRTLQLANYRTPTLPTPPPSRRWDLAVPTWLQAGNDRLGNCVIATAAHELLCMRANASGATNPITDAAVIELSYAMDAENGYSILDRLKWWQHKGMWSNKLGAYAAIGPEEGDLTQSAIDIFGCADIGINLPRAWQHNEIWDTGHGAAYRAGSWGGHSVPIVAYDKDYFYVVTWGYVQQMTYDAYATYCDERYAIIDQAWLKPDGRTPSGFDMAALQADLTALAAQDPADQPSPRNA